MLGGGKRSNLALIGLAALGAVIVIVAVVTRPHPEIAPLTPRYDLEQCGYEQARASAEAAASRREHPSAARSERAARQAAHEAESAEYRQRAARECEERIHDNADLAAQRQSAVAAQNAYKAAQSLWAWSYLELALLLFTVGVGIVAVIVTKQASDDQIKTLESESKAAAERAEAELTEAQKATNEARRVGQAQVRCYPYISDVVMRFGGDEETESVFVSGGTTPGMNHPWMPKISFTLHNGGESPALRAFWRPSVRYNAITFTDGNQSHNLREASRCFPLSSAQRESEWGETVPSRSERPFSADVHTFLTEDELDALQKPGRGLGVVVVISLCFRDVFDNVFEESHCFSGGTSGGVPQGFPVSLTPVPIDMFIEPQGGIVINQAGVFGTVRTSPKKGADQDAAQ